MSEEKKESRINVQDLPQDEKELTAEEAKEVKGGLTKVGAGTLTLSTSNVATGDVNGDGVPDLIVGAGGGDGGNVK